jgi:hypothetical protein
MAQRKVLTLSEVEGRADALPLVLLPPEDIAKAFLVRGMRARLESEATGA